jgi:hypothetical protein
VERERERDETRRGARPVVRRRCITSTGSSRGCNVIYRYRIAERDFSPLLFTACDGCYCEISSAGRRGRGRRGFMGIAYDIA